MWGRGGSGSASSMWESLPRQESNCTAPAHACLRDKLNDCSQASLPQPSAPCSHSLVRGIRKAVHVA